MAARLFISQSVLDRWLSDAAVDVTGDTLTLLADDHQFALTTAVLFEKEVTEAGDPHGLLGKVKDLEQIAALGGDYSAGTVIVGDEAYEVTDGFAGVAVQGNLMPALASLPPPPMSAREAELTTSVDTAAPTSVAAAQSAAGDLAAAIGAATPGAASTKENELDLLARFFLEKR